MEEKKNQEMENMKGVDAGKREQKLTYEQLNDACNQLWQQNQQLGKRVKELEEFCMFKRLDYLFKVVELKNVFSAEFVIACANEIESALNDVEEK